MMASRVPASFAAGCSAALTTPVVTRPRPTRPDSSACACSAYQSWCRCRAAIAARRDARSSRGDEQARPKIPGIDVLREELARRAAGRPALVDKDGAVDRAGLRRERRPQVAVPLEPGRV